jgi:hypothetical protein
VLLPNVYLLKVYNSSFTQILSTDSSSIALGFTIYVEASQEEYINARLATSTVYLVKLSTKNLDRETVNSGETYYEDEAGTLYMADAEGNMYVIAEDGTKEPYEATGDETFTEIDAPETDDDGTLSEDGDYFIDENGEIVTGESDGSESDTEP